MYRALKSDYESVVLVWRGHCLPFWRNLPDCIIQSKQWNKNFKLRVAILCSSTWAFAGCIHSARVLEEVLK